MASAVYVYLAAAASGIGIGMQEAGSGNGAHVLAFRIRIHRGRAGRTLSRTARNAPPHPHRGTGWKGSGEPAPEFRATAGV